MNQCWKFSNTFAFLVVAVIAVCSSRHYEDLLLHNSSIDYLEYYHPHISNDFFLGSSSQQGPRMVRDVFRLAKENAPAIIFIDEVDAIATARFDAQTGADREVQRILMELLN